MHIIIVVEDRLISVDGKVLQVPNVDWAAFNMDPKDPNDDVVAVHFNTDTGHGHAEFKTLVTKQATRPNSRPPDWQLTKADFEKHFAFVLPAYESRLREVQAEEAAQAARLADLQANPPTAAPAQETFSKEQVEQMISDRLAKFASDLDKAI